MPAPKPVAEAAKAFGDNISDIPKLLASSATQKSNLDRAQAHKTGRNTAGFSRSFREKNAFPNVFTEKLA